MKWGNNDIDNLWEGDSEFSTLDEYNYKVPTYYKIRRCDWGTGQLRIEYRWFYGWQPDADHGCGQDHTADWEHIMVTTSEDRQGIAAITYYQHKGWYTRTIGRWKTEAGHPVVYVGKTAHGSYHDDGGSGTCVYYEDWRNPSSDSIWYTWETPLINLDVDSQGWIKFDRLVGGWAWGYYNGEEKVWGPVTTSELCGIRACKGKTHNIGDASGCLLGKSNCKFNDCYCRLYVCATSCGGCGQFWEEYENDYWIPTSDSGFYGTSQ